MKKFEKLVGRLKSKGIKPKKCPYYEITKIDTCWNYTIKGKKACELCLGRYFMTKEIIKTFNIKLNDLITDHKLYKRLIIKYKQNKKRGEKNEDKKLDKEKVVREIHRHKASQTARKERNKGV